MERRWVNILCVQETKWKGAKAKELGGGYKLLYNGNGIGIILDEGLKKNVLSVERRSDRVMCIKVDMDGKIGSIMSAYAPQVGCSDVEKETFWEEMKKVTKIPQDKIFWIRGNLNGHTGCDSSGREEVMGIFAHGVKNVEGERILYFVQSKDIVGINTFYKKT